MELYRTEDVGGKALNLCKHAKYIKIDNIKSPKWSTDEILINVDRVHEDVEHYIIQFTDESPKNKYGWFYMSGKMIRRFRTQPNGRGNVYVVPMSRREEFIPIKENCGHDA